MWGRTWVIVQVSGQQREIASEVDKAVVPYSMQG